MKAYAWIIALMMAAFVSAPTVAQMSSVERAAIAYECEQLIHKFTLAQDRRDSKGMAAVFSEDAVWHIGGEAIKGRAGIVKRAGDFKDFAKHFSSRHIVSNVIIDVDNENRARGSAYVTDYFYDAAKLPQAKFMAPVMIAIYDLAFTRTKEGWRIQNFSFTRDAANFDRP